MSDELIPPNLPCRLIAKVLAMQNRFSVTFFLIDSNVTAQGRCCHLGLFGYMQLCGSPLLSMTANWMVRCHLVSKSRICLLIPSMHFAGDYCVISSLQVFIRQTRKPEISHGLIPPNLLCRFGPCKTDLVLHFR